MAHILLVDDHPDIVRLLEISLRKGGHQISTASNGVEGLDMIRRCRPDLVILDVVMPELDGFRVLHRVRSDPEVAGTLILMLTVKEQPEEMAVGLHFGADFYLTKPFHPDDVESLVRRALEGRAREEEQPAPGETPGHAV